MSANEYGLASRRVVSGGRLQDAVVLVRGEKISAVVPRGAVPAGVPVTDLGNQALLPGIVDCHAHINEPGRTEWEGFVTATGAAAAGGTTTVVDMPLNSIPATTTLEALRVKAETAQGRCAIDYGLWGGVVPGNAGELEAMVGHGAIGFKCFLIHSGVDEFPQAKRADLEKAMPILARLGVPLLVHAELTDNESPVAGDVRRYQSYLASRPRKWEDDAIRMMIELCAKHGGPVHIVHLSSSDALADIAQAKRKKLPFSVETCPHYLTFTSEEIADGATHFKCAPPIRESENREKLWTGLFDGTIDLVVSDHSPCTPGLKHLDQGDFANAWGGIASLQFSLSAVWTGLSQRAKAFGLAPDQALVQLTRWMCEAPAKLTGLTGTKGTIAPGADADFAVFDAEAEFTLDPKMVRHRHSITPYAGRTLRGKVAATYLRGTKIHDGAALLGAPSGQRLSRKN